MGVSLRPSSRIVWFHPVVPRGSETHQLPSIAELPRAFAKIHVVPPVVPEPRRPRGLGGVDISHPHGGAEQAWRLSAVHHSAPSKSTVGHGASARCAPNAHRLSTWIVTTATHNGPGTLRPMRRKNESNYFPGWSFGQHGKIKKHFIFGPQASLAGGSLRGGRRQRGEPREGGRWADWSPPTKQARRETHTPL